MSHTLGAVPMYGRRISTASFRVTRTSLTRIGLGLYDLHSRLHRNRVGPLDVLGVGTTQGMSTISTSPANFSVPTNRIEDLGAGVIRRADAKKLGSAGGKMRPFGRGRRLETRCNFGGMPGMARGRQWVDYGISWTTLGTQQGVVKLKKGRRRQGQWSSNSAAGVPTWKHVYHGNRNVILNGNFARCDG